MKYAISLPHMQQPLIGGGMKLESGVVMLLELITFLSMVAALLDIVLSRPL
ncbi:hypothetical protein [Xanthomonas translucens]|jgi:hypothetical protein|uniref:hypothetical protein n=1 Tax=Xanthomonas campestris pv. translucens TaxID=343 RepID=UPI0013049E53|nr:hypothetical protein [Xanthomonas translucens]